MERRRGADSPGQGVEKVEQVGIDGRDLPRPVVAEDAIDLLQGFGTVPPPDAVGRIQGFIGVRVVEGKPSHGGGETIQGTERRNGG